MQRYTARIQRWLAGELVSFLTDEHDERILGIDRRALLNVLKNIRQNGELAHNSVK